MQEGFLSQLEGLGNKYVDAYLKDKKGFPNPQLVQDFYSTIESTLHVDGGNGQKTGELTQTVPKATPESISQEKSSPNPTPTTPTTSATPESVRKDSEVPRNTEVASALGDEDAGDEEASWADDMAVMAMMDFSQRQQQQQQTSAEEPPEEKEGLRQPFDLEMLRKQTQMSSHAGPEAKPKETTEDTPVDDGGITEVFDK